MDLIKCLFLLGLIASFDVKPQEAFHVELAIDVVGQTRHDVGLIGTTNLPTGTNILVTLSDLYRGKTYQDKVQVNSGSFSAGPFGTKSGLGDSKYHFEVTVPVVQPTNVAAIIGKKKAKLEGDAVADAAITGKTAKASLNFTIGNEDSVDEVLNSIIANTLEFKRGLTSLLENDAKAIASARESNNEKACVNAMRSALAKADRLSSQSNDIYQKAIELKIAAGYMSSCLTCIESAQLACNEARSALETSKF